MTLENPEEIPHLRYSVSLVTQGNHKFYTLTMPSDVLARTCFVSTRYNDPKEGFQRLLDKSRALEIATYIDEGLGTIPSSVVLSAQPDAELQDIGKGKTIQFRDTQKAFLILDGQHRVYGFGLAQTALRVPVVVYNNLSRQDESRLFIDINTKQRPVSNELLLDIKKLAAYESDAENLLGRTFDLFQSEAGSPLLGMLSSSEKKRGKISRVTFYAAFRPLLPAFDGKGAEDVYSATSEYLNAFKSCLREIGVEDAIVKPSLLRASMLLFTEVGQRVKLKHGSNYTADRFHEVLKPMFSRVRATSLTRQGETFKDIHSAFAKALRTDFTL